MLDCHIKAFKCIWGVLDQNKKGAFFIKGAFVHLRRREPFLGNFNQICLHMHNKQTNSLAGHNRVFAEQIHLEIKL